MAAGTESLEAGPATASPQATDRVGLLFVHGIGEQKRFEHVTESVGSFAILLRKIFPHAAVNVVDRTAQWPHSAGDPRPDSAAPVVLSLRTKPETPEGQPADFPPDTDFECHEVWWADLGYKDSLAAIVLFWIWGLGQWCAPIYETLDTTRVSYGPDRTAPSGTGAAARPDLTIMPVSVAGSVWREVRSRFLLLAAGLAAILVALTWSLAKRIFAKILGATPSPTLIVQYVGDVQCYEMRGSPNDTSLPYPGLPPRVAIRQRMISEMVAMAGRGYKRWYVVAHSLGTVVAYNGLTELGHTLPNYLSKAQWRSVSRSLRSRHGIRTRAASEIAAMVPPRPGWLDDQDVINRKALFETFAGFLTYGSPLNKFAALWPRILATADDVIPDPADPDNRSPFGQAEWLNLVAIQDPVAGNLDQFGGEETVAPVVPTLKTLWTRPCLDFVLAHIEYFSAGIHKDKGDKADPKVRALEWLAGGAFPGGSDGMKSPRAFASHVFATLGYTVIIVTVWVALTAVAALAGNTLSAVLSASKASSFGWSDLELHFWHLLWPVMVIALSLLTLCGQCRWCAESMRNVVRAHADRAPQPIIRLVWLQSTAAVLLAAMLAAGVIAVWRSAPPTTVLTRAAAEGLALWMILVMCVQAGVNWLCRAILGRAPRRASAPASDE